MDIWEAAEAVAGRPLPAPFWAYAWAAGCALARVLLDQPQLVAGRRVLDVGCGGGVTALAAARAGAAEVVANDVDPWALATLALAAERQNLPVRPLLDDLTRHPDAAAGFDVVLCCDLAYERSQADPQRALLRRLLESGARVLAADAERAYFVADGLRLLAEYQVRVPRDLEGVEVRTARVYEMG
ncbi:MAG TPA: methyltransferase domain-containing protein [Longimicrobiales bacterium]